MSLTGTVQSFDKLPATPAVGDTYRVEGAPGVQNAFTSYYVRYSADAVWDETVAPGLENRIDADTMPHCLIRQADGSFLFTPFAWADRTVGDDDTNPKPGFIGRTINGVFFYQNRLAFLYDERVVLSAAGDFGNFWRNTVLDYVDSDVVDVSPSSTKVSILQRAIPFNDGIMLFSDQTQFSMTNGEAGVTPSSVAIKPVTNYPVEGACAPEEVNTEVYFASGNANHEIIYEYTRGTQSDNTTAANITAHVPRYLPRGVHQIIPAQDQNALFVLTDGAPNRVYVYQFYWLSSDTKAQSAWHYWEFEAGVTIRSATYLDGVLYMLVERSDGLYLEKVELEYGIFPVGSPIQIHMDGRYNVLGEYHPEDTQQGYDGWTLFRLPYPVPESQRANFRIVKTEQFGAAGLSEVPLRDKWAWTTDSTVWVPNRFDHYCFVGFKYEFRYRFSRPFVRRPDNTAVTSGRLQLRTLTLDYRDTITFKWEVWPYGLGRGEPVSGDYGWRVGDQPLGWAPKYYSGRTEIPIGGNADTTVVDIINDDIWGCAFQAAEWRGFYFNTSKG